MRVSGRVREDKSICTTEFYHKGNEEVGCRSFPLKVNNQNETIRYQASATIDTKMDFMQSSSDASESKYYLEHFQRSCWSHLQRGVDYCLFCNID